MRTPGGALLGRIARETRGWLIPLAVVLAANAVVFGAVVYPLSGRVAGSEARAASDEVALRAAQRDLTLARATATGKIQAEGELQQFYERVLPADFAAARHLLYLRLSQIAREANLQYKRQTFDEPRVRPGDEGSLRKLTLHLSLEGSYENIREFVHALETAPEFIVVENIALAMRGEGNAPLVVNLVLSTFYRAEGQ